MENLYKQRFYDNVVDKNLNEVVSSDNFVELFSKVAGLIIEYKIKNGGGLPKEIWLKLLELSGSYLCAEIIVKDCEGNLYLKKRKDETAVNGELGWEGKLHIPGLSTTATMRADEIVDKLLVKEILKDQNEISGISKKVSLIGFVRYPEPERKTVADTLLFEVILEKKSLQDDFYQVDVSGIPIIDEHKPTIDWYNYGVSRPWVIDMRIKE